MFENETKSTDVDRVFRKKVASRPHSSKKRTKSGSKKSSLTNILMRSSRDEAQFLQIKNIFNKSHEKLDSHNKSHDFTDYDSTPLERSLVSSSVIGVTNTVNYQNRSNTTLSEFKKIIKKNKKSVSKSKEDPYQRQEKMSTGKSLQSFDEN